MAASNSFTNQHRQRVLTKGDLDSFEKNGYVIVKQAVPQTNCQQLIDDIWTSLGFDRSDLDSCYRHPLLPNGFVPLYHSQAEWVNRTHPAAFADLWGTDQLWVSIDRCGLKLPYCASHKSHSTTGFTHWDMDPTGWDASSMNQLQGVLCLCDTSPDMGGFHCYPGMHRYLTELLSSVDIPQTDVDKYYANATPIKVPNPDVTLRDLDHHTPAVKAGDLIIFKGEVAHGNGKNVSTTARLAQYISMYPAEPDNYSFRATRIDCWKRKLPSGAVAYPQLSRLGGPPEGAKSESGTPAQLTELGRKLLGLDDW